MSAKTGTRNIRVGLVMMAGFMLYGFYLIYARDFAPDKAEWIANANVTPHFEARLAHVHGNLFALLNIVFGLVLLNVGMSRRMAKLASGLALGGMLMPLGILGELYLGLPPVFVLIGGISIVAATATLALGICRGGDDQTS